MDITQAAQTIATGIAAPAASAAPEGQTAGTEEGGEGEAPPSQPPRRSATAFNLLAKKESALQKERQSIAADRAAAAAERAELAADRAKVQKYLDAEALKGKDKLAAIRALDLTYDEITDAVIGSAETPEAKIEALVKRLNELEGRTAKEKEESEKNAVEEARKQAEAGERQYKAEIAQFISAKADEFPLCAKMQPIELMFMVAEETWKQTGKVLTVTEISSNVEKYLEDQFTEAFELPKFSSRYQKVPPKEETPAEPARDVPRSSAPPRTITSQMTPTAQPAAPRSYSSSHDIEKDAVSRALAALTRGG